MFGSGPIAHVNPAQVLERVDEHALLALERPSVGHVDDVLQRLERLAAVADQQFCLFAGQIQARTVIGFLDVDLVQNWKGNVVFLQSTCTANWMANNVSGWKSLAMQAMTQPQGGISAGATRGRDPGQSDVTTSFDAGLDIGYEVDLFGRVSRGVEAARGDVGAAQADANAVRVAIVAETARAYADAANAAERLAVAQHIVELLDGSLKLTEKRVEVGLNSQLDTARIATLRNQRQAEIPAIAAERDNALFRLAMLTGRAPAELPQQAGARDLSLQLSQPIPVGDGTQLLARRPDVRAAERRLAAATARIGVATAELYPRISLGGSLGASAGSLGNLFSNPIGFLLGPLISWSFSDHARARARVAGAEAGAQALWQPHPLPIEAPRAHHPLIAACHLREFIHCDPFRIKTDGLSRKNAAIGRAKSPMCSPSDLVQCWAEESFQKLHRATGGHIVSMSWMLPCRHVI